MNPVVTITTAQGQTITVEFHKTAYRCWHVVFPSHVERHLIEGWLASMGLAGDYVYSDIRGCAVLATSSLERGMGAAAEQIVRTEF